MNHSFEINKLWVFTPLHFYWLKSGPNPQSSGWEWAASGTGRDSTETVVADPLCRAGWTVSARKVVA